jgi:WD40 repeat protein
MGNCQSETKKNYEEKKRNVEIVEEPVSEVAVHEDSVLGVSCYNGVVASCSADKTIAITDFSSFTSRKLKPPIVLSGHTKAVNRIVFHTNSSHLYSASRDLSIKLVSFRS